MARLAAEFSVIVLGVLVALGVDAAVGRRAAGNREAAMLGALRDDIAQSREELSVSNAITESRVESIGRMLSVPLDGSLMPHADSVRTWAAAIYVTGSYAPISSAYDQLIFTGTLDVLENGELRVELARLRSTTDQYLDYRRQTTEVWNLVGSEAFQRHVSIEALTNAASIEALRLIDALGQLEFRNAVFNRRMFLRSLRANGRRLESQMDVVLELIDQELSARGAI